MLNCVTMRWIVTIRLILLFVLNAYIASETFANEGLEETEQPEELEVQPQGLWKISSYLQDYANAAYSKFHTLVGDMYKSGEPYRHHWEIFRDVLSQLNLEQMTLEDQVDTIAKALIAEIAKTLPKSFNIDPFEVDGLKYMCATGGTITDLRTIKYLNTRKKFNGESVTFYITFTFDDLIFTYETFYLKFFFSLRGKIEIKYEENEVVLVIRIPSMTTFLSEVMSAKCLLYIEDIIVNELKVEYCKISNVKKKCDWTLELAQNKIKEYLLENEESLERNFETQVLVQVHKRLNASGAWICKANELATNVRQRGGHTDEYVPTPKFTRKCLSKKNKTK